MAILGRRADKLAQAAAEIGDKAGVPVETFSADLADPEQATGSGNGLSNVMAGWTCWRTALAATCDTAVQWLASPEARHASGQSIQVNGGAERGP